MKGYNPIPQTHLSMDGDTLVAERWQDVEPILEHNKALRALSQKSDWGRHIASIPCVILERWWNEEVQRGNVTLNMFGKEMDKIIARKLKDPDWAFLRTDK